jgi:hypothetical protein
MPITFQGNPVPSDVVTRTNGDPRYVSPYFWNVVPTNDGWTSTSVGAGTSLTQGALTLSLQCASTVALSSFGSITAYINQGTDNQFRLGTGIGVGGYGTLNFGNTLYFFMRMGSIFNFSNTRTDWVFTVGNQVKNVALSGLLPLSASNTGYCALECLSGSLRIVNLAAGAVAVSATRGQVIDSWSSGQNHKSYMVEVRAGTVTVYNGFNGAVLGSLSGAPINADFTPQGASFIAFGAQSNASSVTVTDRINIYNFAMGFVP